MLAGGAEGDWIVQEAREQAAAAGVADGRSSGSGEGQGEDTSTRRAAVRETRPRDGGPGRLGPVHARGEPRQVPVRRTGESGPTRLSGDGHRRHRARAVEQPEEFERFAPCLPRLGRCEAAVELGQTATADSTNASAAGARSAVSPPGTRPITRAGMRPGGRLRARASPPRPRSGAGRRSRRHRADEALDGCRSYRSGISISG